MTKTPQPVWLVRVRSSGMQFDSRFFTDRAKLHAFCDKMQDFGYHVRVTLIPLLDDYRTFRAFMADAA